MQIRSGSQWTSWLGVLELIILRVRREREAETESLGVAD